MDDLKNTIKIWTCDDINEPQDVEDEVEFAEVEFHLRTFCFQPGPQVDHIVVR